jgi:hypothetical protein
MDPFDTSHRVGPRRPKSLNCAACGKRFKVKPKGVVGMYCSGACKQAAFAMRERLSRPEPEPKPKKPKLSLERRVAECVFQMLIDRNVITPVKPDQE